MASILEQKTRALKTLLSEYDSTALLKFIAHLFIQMEQRHTNPFLKGLHSPLRQLVYAADVSIQTEQRTDSVKIPYQYKLWDKDWEEIKQLLIQIEHQYFLDIGFHTEAGKDTDPDKIKAVLPTFMNYFFNGNLSYPEQDIERLERTFLNNETILVEATGLTASDFVSFYDSVLETINQRINKNLKFFRPGEWQKFTSQCIEKGLLDPHQWIEEAPEEILDSIQFIKDPGQIFIFQTKDFKGEKLSEAKIKKLIALLSCSKQPTESLVFYTDDSLLLKKPIFRLDEEHFIVFHCKQILNAAYSALFELVKAKKGLAAYRQRDILLEEKTMEVFKAYFGRDAHYYMNYTVDNHSEQDILVLHKGFALIVEVKAGTYREPMRHPGKAFEKLKSDFKGSIQYGYDQIWRVKEKFHNKRPFLLYSKEGNVLFTIHPQKYPDVFSVVVTLERFGNIQNDLSIMLKIQEEDVYPWSICIDDLEVFLLALKKRSKGTQNLRTFLKHRADYHGHVICGDELELCAHFLHRPKQFMEDSRREDIICTDPGYTKIFEEYYRKGLGFKKERHWKGKKEGSIGFLFAE